MTTHQKTMTTHYFFYSKSTLSNTHILTNTVQQYRMWSFRLSNKPYEKSLLLQLPEGLWEAPWRTLYPPQSATGHLPLLYFFALRSSPQFYLKRKRKHTTHTLYNKIKKHLAADHQDEEWWEHKSRWRNTNKTPLSYCANKQILPSSFHLTQNLIRSVTIWQWMREIHTLEQGQSRLSISQQAALMIFYFSPGLPILLCTLVKCLCLWG